MAKVGVEIRIDVTKIPKEKLYKGKKGTYLTMTSFINLDEIDQYGNNGMVVVKKDKDEQDSPILGNAQIFWSDSWDVKAQRGEQNNQQSTQATQVTQSDMENDFDQDIPFS